MTMPPHIFSSDDEAHLENASVTNGQPKALANVPSGESELLAKMTELLKGIAPATCKRSCAEMLECIEKNKDLLELPSVSYPVYEQNPKVFYMNSDIVSEQISEASMKLQAKYIQHETYSSYSIWAETARQLTLNSINRQQYNGVSPGRRLSHLAKRRQMFSKANLQQLAQNEPKNHRLAIKTNLCHRNLAKEYLEFKQIPKSGIPKRALFQSPDDPPVRPGFQTVAKQVPRRRLFADLNRNGPVAELPHGGGCYDVSSWLASQPFVNDRKRGREDSEDRKNPKRRCPRRSLDFSDASPSQASQVSSHSSSAPTVALSNIQKQKLLWAVATTLKEKEMTHKHQHFKECAKKLFNQCRKNLATILALQVPSGTTEKMLTYARQHVNSVLEKLDRCDGVLSDLSNVTVKPQTVISTAEGKENVYRTPNKRVRKPRIWRTCTKSLKKKKTLNRSLSCDNLKENLITGCKRKRETSTNNTLEVFNEIENTPAKINPPENAKSAIVMESPDENILDASQEHVEFSTFPALIKSAPKSPDLFADEEEAEAERNNFSSLEILPQTNVIENFPLADESALPADITNISLDLSCITADQEITTLQENNEDVNADIEDNTSESSSDDERDLCTSTPISSVPKHVLRRNKPAWKVEAGPGLKIRVRLSKEWDIVGRKLEKNSVTESETTGPEIDLKEPPVETQIKNPLLTRLNSVETSGSSTDNYNLMELRDKLDIERTLDADPSEFSFFESSPNSVSNSEHVETIVKISPEVTINCYSNPKGFSVYDSDSSSSDDDDENEALSNLQKRLTVQNSPLIANKTKTNELSPIQLIQEKFNENEQIIYKTFSDLSWMVQQKIQSTICEETDFETKVRELSRLNEINEAQQQLYTYFRQQTMEMREQLS